MMHFSKIGRYEDADVPITDRSQQSNSRQQLTYKSVSTNPALKLYNDMNSSHIIDHEQLQFQGDLGDELQPSITDDESDHTARPSWQSQGFLEAQRRHIEEKRSRITNDRYDNPFKMETLVSQSLKQ